MVRIRDATAVALAIIIILSAIPISIGDSNAIPADMTGTKNNGVLIYELRYDGDSEGFALKNYGTSTVKLSDYSVKAQSKTFTLADATLSSNSIAVFIKKDTAGDWFCEEKSGRDVYTDSKITINNTKGYIYLLKGTTIIDTLVYGNYTESVTGWIGNGVDFGNMKDAVRRVESTDTNTYFDWTATSNGYTSHSYDGAGKYSSQVEPFTFPECQGIPVLNTLNNATKTIDISIYMLTSGYVHSVLENRLADGVDVRILLENKPLGYDNPTNSLKHLVDKGALIKYIGHESAENTDRYSYVHNKYAIVDSETVIITSENWTKDNISDEEGNRGWGAVIYGKSFAEKMSQYFENDWNHDADTIEFSKAHPDAVAAKPPAYSTVTDYIKNSDYSAKKYSANVTIYMSPDNTFKALQDLISNAKSRVYTEQMDLGAAWTKDLTALSPLKAMIDAADKGLDVRFMISSDADIVKTLNETTNVKAAKMGNIGYATMHNKGVIIDNMTWVSSVNWTENSFMNNRECGLLIDSKEVTDFYLQSYMTDWNNYYDGYLHPCHGFHDVFVPVGSGISI